MRVEVETDTLQIIRAAQFVGSTPWRRSNILQECGHIISLHSITISQVCRSGNESGHHLSKAALTSFTSITSLHHPLPPHAALAIVHGARIS